MQTETKAAMLSDCSKNRVSSKLVARNTVRIEYDDGSVAIRFHHTDIVVWSVDGNVTLSSGGWRTMTTKERLDTFSKMRVRQDKGLWYVNGEYFYDGITFDKDGKLVGKSVPPNTDEVIAMKKRIDKFCLLITEDNIPAPSSGDCWDCCLRTQDGVPMGEAFPNPNHGHLLSHIEEGYMHGSLILNAMLESGYQNNGQIGLLISMKYFDRIRKCVRKYLQKRLIPNIQVK